MTKIAFVVQNFPKLSETFICRQAESLEAIVLCDHFDAPLYAELGLTVSHYALSKRNEFFHFLKRAASKAGFYFDYWDRRQRREVASFLEKEGVDVVLAQYGPNGIKVAPVCEALDIPLVIHFHGYDLSRLLRLRWYSAALRRALRTAKFAVVVNHRMKQRLVALGFPGQRVRVIPCGVDVENYAVGDRSRRSTCTFLAVGRLVEKKAPLLTVKAFERCTRECAGARLNVIGDGPLRDEVEEYVRGSDQRERISLLGALSHSEVKGALASADVFVQHSVTARDGDEEGWPVSIAEAAASGLPVVATRHSGIPTQVLNGETGYLVEEGDYGTMGEKMAMLARNAELRQQMGREARKHIEANGDLQVSLRRLEEVLRAARNQEERKPAVHLSKPLLGSKS